MEQTFWNTIEKPIIGLAPMDGCTDAPFRRILTKYGKPSIFITEFTSVEGICAGALKPLTAFIYDEEERPILAQLFGITPECFYKATIVTADLGFDGVDINMGCPSKNIAVKGAGAGLIQTPELAKKIIIQAKKAAKDWANGLKTEDLDLPDTIKEYVKNNRPKNIPKKNLPISVKTRIGYNSNIVEEWIKNLLETEPACISIHGRTLKQMYTGTSDWEAISLAAKIIKKTNTLVLGNGDIKTIKQAKETTRKYNLDGVLIGRAALGNPFIFNPNHDPDSSEDITKKLTIAAEHSQYFEEMLKEIPFIHMRKHLAWYCRGFHSASTVRQKLMQTNNSAEVKTVLDFHL